MTDILLAENVTVRYGKSVAVRDLSIRIPQGRIVTLIGANGAGKSTTLNSIVGVVPRTEGRVVFLGEDISLLPIQKIVQRGVVSVPEGRHLFPYLSVYKNLLLGASQRSDKEGIQADFEYVYRLFPKLKDRRNQKAGTLSGGEQQMVAIARGLMSGPKLLCLDEPSLGLAPVVIEQLGETIRDINGTKGVSILLVEQNVHLAFGVADYCYALSVGKIVAEGPVDAVKDSGIVRKAYFGQ
jgi:branched-chain amino acid transport system ATP-binding protein